MTPTAITSTQKWRGRDTALTIEIAFAPDSKSRACITEVQSKVTIENESGEKDVVAGFNSYTLSKTVRSRRAPAWLKEILLEPLDYKHSRLNHSVASDPQDDLTKIFQLIFDHNGNVKEHFLQWADILTSDQIHYIDTFEVVERFRGTGMARVAMNCYKEALRQLHNDDPFEGTIILSPAGLRSVRENMLQQPRPADRPVKSFLEIEDALVEGYKKDGFAVWHRGDRAQEGAAITIMGMSTVQRSSTPSKINSFNQVTHASQRRTQDLSPIDDMRQLSITPSTQQPQAEQPLLGTTTAVTTSMDEDDIAMDGGNQSAKATAGAPSMPTAETGAAYNSSDNSNTTAVQPLPTQLGTLTTDRRTNKYRPRLQPRQAPQKVSRMVAELNHKNDENGSNPHLQPDDGRRYEATNGARYQLAVGTKAQWIKKDLSRAVAVPSNALTSAATQPRLRPKRRAAESQVTGGGFKKLSSGSNLSLITTGMDEIPASRSAEPIDGWHPDCFWAVEDFVDERLGSDGLTTTHVLVDWAEHANSGTKWEATWEEYDMLNDNAKELFQKWRIDTGRALTKKQRGGR